MQLSVLPNYKKVPGQIPSLFKRDRGERAGKYILVVELESVELRDQISPLDEEEQGDAETEAVWEKFFSLVENDPGATFTDYAMISG